MGSGGVAPHILNLCTRWNWVASFTPQLLYPGERTPVQQSWSDRNGEEKKIPAQLKIGHNHFPHIPSDSSFTINLPAVT